MIQIMTAILTYEDTSLRVIVRNQNEQADHDISYKNIIIQRYYKQLSNSKQNEENDTDLFSKA